MVLGHAVAVLGRAPLGRRITRTRGRPGDMEQDQPECSAGRGVGPVARTECPRGAVVAPLASCRAVHDQEWCDRVGGGVDAAQVEHGIRQGPYCADEHREVGWPAAGEHGVHGDDPPGGLPVAGRQGRDDLVGVDGSQGGQHPVDALGGRGDEGEAVAPALGLVCLHQRDNVTVGHVEHRRYVCFHQAPVCYYSTESARADRGGDRSWPPVWGSIART